MVKESKSHVPRPQLTLESAIQTVRMALDYAHGPGPAGTVNGLRDELHLVLDTLEEATRRTTEVEERLDEIVEFVCALASQNFEQRLEMRDDWQLDTLAASINMLCEELFASSVSRDFVQNIINSIPDALLVTDPQGIVHMTNAATDRMLGSADAGALGRRLSDVFTLPTEVMQNQDIIWQDRSGRQIPLSLSNAPALDEDGAVAAHVWLAKNMSAWKKLELELESTRDQALQSSRLKSEFLANMSHEIRTPINGVLGMLDLLQNTVLSNNQGEMVKAAQDSANVLLYLISDILDFSKIEAGALVFESIDFELQSIVDDTVQLLAPRARAKGLDLSGLVMSERTVILQGDPGRLRQVIINLLSNAIKFTERGEVSVRVELQTSPSEKEIEIRVEIQDTGIGISEEQLKSVFDAFVQADGSTTRAYGGTGLGLAICSQIVHLFDGDIGVHSTLGVGSTFWFTARFKRGRQPPLESRRVNEALTGLNLLIVGLDSPNRGVVEYYADSWCMHWKSVSDGRDALIELRRAALSRFPYDIALLDFQLADIDGITLARFIDLDPGIPELKILLLKPVGVLTGDDALATSVASLLPSPVSRAALFREMVQRRDTMVLSAFESEPDTQEMLTSELPYAHVLVVDDNPINAKVARGQLRMLGLDADMASDGLKALQALEKANYSLIFMDCQMPNLDGFETARRIRQNEAQGQHIAIVAMTANAFDGIREKCLAAGMDDYISKPVSKDSLARALQRWLNP